MPFYYFSSKDVKKLLLTLSPYIIKYVMSGILLSYIKSHYYKWVNLVPYAIFSLHFGCVFCPPAHVNFCICPPHSFKIACVSRNVLLTLIIPFYFSNCVHDGTWLVFEFFFVQIKMLKLLCDECIYRVYYIVWFREDKK